MHIRTYRLTKEAQSPDGGQCEDTMRSVRLQSLVNSTVTMTKIPAGSTGRVKGFTLTHCLAIESLMAGKAWQ